MTTSATSPDLVVSQPGRGLSQLPGINVLRRLLRDPVCCVALIILLLVVLCAVFAPLVRAQTLSLEGLDYAHAARAMGAPAYRILLRHILPNTLAPIIVQASLGMAFAILAEAGLSFLGVGIKPPTATWGGMLQT